MKEEPQPSFYLNLYNFDTPEAQKCPHILTSPRSLEACRRLGCKPVELLYRSVEDYEEELSGIALKEIYQVYQQREKERQEKLESCRFIRKQIVQSEDKSKDKGDSNPSKPQTSTADVPEVGINLHDEQEEGEETEGGESLEPEAEQTRVRKSSGDSKPESDQHYLKFIDSVSHDAFESTPGPSYDDGLKDVDYKTESSSGNSPSSEKAKVEKKGKKKGKWSPKARPKSAKVYSRTAPRRQTTLSRVSSAQTLRDAKKLSHRVNTRGGINLSPSCSHSILSLQSPLAHDDNNNRGSPRKKQVSFSCRRRLTDRYHLSPRRFVRTRPVKPKALVRVADVDILHRNLSGFISLEDLRVPEHDRRILWSLALKKESERESEEHAQQAHVAWEEEREQREKALQEQTRQWQNFVAEKRWQENEENARRLAELEEAANQAREDLEKTLKDKEERCCKLLQELEQRKLTEQRQQKRKELEKRVHVELMHQKILEEEANWRRAVEAVQRQRLLRAESARSNLKEGLKERVATHNRSEELRHLQRRRQLERENEAALQELRYHCVIKEQRATEKHHETLRSRMKQSEKLGLTQNLRRDQVHQLKKELEVGFAQWRARVYTLQEDSINSAMNRAQHQMWVLRKKLAEENHRREWRHAQLLNDVRKREAGRERAIRLNILQKEVRAQRVTHERERAILESRITAQTTADLREQLRRNLTPETFDRKVARAALEMRFSHYPPSPSSSNAYRSHILLG